MNVPSAVVADLETMGFGAVTHTQNFIWMEYPKRNARPGDRYYPSDPSGDHGRLVIISLQLHVPSLEIDACLRVSDTAHGDWRRLQSDQVDVQGYARDPEALARLLTPLFEARQLWTVREMLKLDDARLKRVPRDLVAAGKKDRFDRGINIAIADALFERGVEF